MKNKIRSLLNRIVAFYNMQDPKTQVTLIILVAWILLFGMILIPRLW